MKFRFLPVVLAAVAALGSIAAGARPAQAHDCDDNGWRVSRYRGDFGGDSCRRERYHARRAYYRDGYYGGGYDRVYDSGYDYPSYSRYHARHYYRTSPRVVTVYRTVPVYRSIRHYRSAPVCRVTRHYRRPAHRVTRVVRVTTVYR